jgi:GTP pyrophosphokinase
MMRQYELVERCRAYNPQVDEALLNRAYVYAIKAHGRQKRYSGDPYFSHPIEVAGILTDLKLDTATIAAALLHDTLEDTVATRGEIDKIFGDEIGTLVDGVTKLSRLELTSKEAEAAENFRKLLIAVAADVRVLLVKFADRLHNMRTLHFVPDAEKRKQIAQETMDIYAPLAGRMGMQQIRDELDDLSFRELMPDIYGSLSERLANELEKRGDLFTRIEQVLVAKLSEYGIEARVMGRRKRPASIWRKMQRKSVSFEQLSDIIGFRVILNSAEDCYRALGIIHRTWPAVPGRFKDYISVPKGNDYRSLHTTVVGPEKQRVELQLRTAEMDDVAERGIAAHWKYKEGLSDEEAARIGQKEANAYHWLRNTIEALSAGNSPEEFLEHTKLELFFDQVFCFTPKGRLIALPRGATPIDFAYAVHTDIGDGCIGCRVNGRVQPLRQPLQNGDEVEIIRGKERGPQAIWERFVVTGKARAAIRRFLRAREREEYTRLGRQLILQRLELVQAAASEKEFKSAAAALKFPSVEIMFERLGRGDVAPDMVMRAIHPQADAGKETRQKPRTKTWRKKAAEKEKQPSVKSGQSAIPVRGVIPGLAVQMGNCCTPVPGDRIVGILTPGKGVVIHAIDCETLSAHDDQMENWIDVAWDEEIARLRVPARINVTVANDVGSLGRLTAVIAGHNGNISDLRITERRSDFYEMQVDIDVSDLRHLTEIIQALKSSNAVNAVTRARG